MKQEPKDRHIIKIPESMVQSFAEANFGRELTEIELWRLYWAVFDEEVSHELCNVMAHGIEEAMNNENNRWEKHDECYDASILD